MVFPFRPNRGETEGISSPFLAHIFLCPTCRQQNCLSYLPETIGLATGIRKLNLRGNALRNLPTGFCLLHALETLDIAQNSLVRTFTTSQNTSSAYRVDLRKSARLYHRLGQFLHPPELNALLQNLASWGLTRDFHPSTGFGPSGNPPCSDRGMAKTPAVGSGEQQASRNPT